MFKYLTYAQNVLHDTVAAVTQSSQQGFRAELHEKLCCEFNPSHCTMTSVTPSQILQGKKRKEVQVLLQSPSAQLNIM